MSERGEGRPEVWKSLGLLYTDVDKSVHGDVCACE